MKIGLRGLITSSRTSSNEADSSFTQTNCHRSLLTSSSSLWTSGRVLEFSSRIFLVSDSQKLRSLPRLTCSSNSSQAKKLLQPSSRGTDTRSGPACAPEKSLLWLYCSSANEGRYPNTCPIGQNNPPPTTS